MLEGARAVLDLIEGDADEGVLLQHALQQVAQVGTGPLWDAVTGQRWLREADEVLCHKV